MKLLSRIIITLKKCFDIDIQKWWFHLYVNWKLLISYMFISPSSLIHKIKSKSKYINPLSLNFLFLFFPLFFSLKKVKYRPIITCVNPNENNQQSCKTGLVWKSFISFFCLFCDDPNSGKIKTFKILMTMMQATQTHFTTREMEQISNNKK